MVSQSDAVAFMIQRFFFIAVLMVALAPGPVDACSCIWFFRDVAEEKIVEAASRPPVIVAAQVISRAPVCEQTDPWGEPYPDTRTLEVLNSIRGEVDDTITVGTGSEVDPRSCSMMVSSCGIYPGVGRRGVWALERSANGNLEFSGVCTTDAVRRVLAKEYGVSMDVLGGEVDLVRREFGPLEQEIFRELFPESSKDE